MHVGLWESLNELREKQKRLEELRSLRKALLIGEFWARRITIHETLLGRKNQ